MYIRRRDELVPAQKGASWNCLSASQLGVWSDVHFNKQDQDLMADRRGGGGLPLSRRGAESCDFTGRGGWLGRGEFVLFVVKCGESQITTGGCGRMKRAFATKVDGMTRKALWN